MYKYFISVFLIFIISKGFSQSLEESEEKKDTIIYKTGYGFRLGIDISKPIRALFDKSYSGLEIVGDYRIIELEQVTESRSAKLNMLLISCFRSIVTLSKLTGYIHAQGCLCIFLTTLEMRMIQKFVFSAFITFEFNKIRTGYLK